MNPIATISEIAPRHSAEICAEGRCEHAVSVRIPCQCDTCNAESADWTSRNRRKLELEQAESLSECTPHFLKRRFNTFKTEPLNRDAYDLALEVAQDPRSRGIGIYGPAGVGKSHLAAAICNMCRDARIPSCFVSVEELMDKLRSSFDAKNADAKNTSSALLERYASVAVLALDDWGKEPFSDFSVRTLFALVNRRYVRNLPLIVTANLDERAIGQHYSSTPKGGEKTDPFMGSTMIDRLGEMTSSPWVQITGLSRRGVA